MYKKTEKHLEYLAYFSSVFRISAQLHSPEEELLLTWFEPCEREKANTYFNASQIAAKLAEKAKINITDRTINKLGKALKKHNFIRLKKNGIAVYCKFQ
ncbi:DUF3874 domain-containing protein [Flavobacterium sp. ZE23DGlu08]|uniref:DUF3874 domain-containing protein n=1 Tax=Flavobacterium sp. ZE23DGlu08 TaxID=3059026 RepID=UPI0034667F51